MQVRSFVAQRGVTARAPTASRPPLAYEFAVVRRLAAEQGVLLSNHSSAGSETSAGAERQSKDQHPARLDLNDALEVVRSPVLWHTHPLLSGSGARTSSTPTTVTA